MVGRGSSAAKGGKRRVSNLLEENKCGVSWHEPAAASHTHPHPCLLAAVEGAGGLSEAQDSPSALQWCVGSAMLPEYSICSLWPHRMWDAK